MLETPVLKSLPHAVQRLVVKLGTSTLTAGTAQSSRHRSWSSWCGKWPRSTPQAELLVVTSGAIAAGRARLNFPALPRDIPAKQMLAAVGQPRLMALYEQLFGFYGLVVAQVLLARADLADRRRYLNARNTLAALLTHRVVPVINENDTVATEEIRVGDNDNLSALVANLIEADLLVILTDQPGLFTADPRHSPHAERVVEVREPEISDALWLAAGGPGGSLGTGGMLTKLQAADLARRSGCAVVIARGSDPGVLLEAAAGAPVGTRFHPAATALESRKRYILAGGSASGLLEVDEGAARALRQGSSLLPVGVRRVEGHFERGDTVRVAGPSGRELARGLVHYGVTDLVRIQGRRSDEIEGILGYAYGDEVIHRNDMVLLW